MSLPPVTEDDKASVERMVLQLKRLRKREHEHGPKDNKQRPYGQPDLDDAIEGLMKYGNIKSWWDYQGNY